MYKSNRFLLFTIGILFIFNSCVWDKSAQSPSVAPPPPIGVSYSKDVAPVLSSNCAYSGCHNATNSANFPLQTYSDVINYGQVIAGDPEGSDMYNVIASGFMPLGGSLPATDVQLIYDWIVQGAKNN